MANITQGGLVGGFVDVFDELNLNTRAVLYDYRWTPSANTGTSAGTISFAFPSTSDAFSNPDGGFAPATAAQQDAVSAAFGLVGSYTNVVFSKLTPDVAADATIRVAIGNNPSRAGLPGLVGQAGGEVWLASNAQVPASIAGVAKFFGTDPFLTITHELGHSLGLKHGHYETLNPLTFNYNVVLAPNVNDNEFSVMTYASYLDSPINPASPAPTAAKEGSAPQSYMMYDIAALQFLYGANFNKVGSNDTYRWDTGTGQETINNSMAPWTGASSTGKIFSTVWTQGATATYDLHLFGQNQVDDLRPGHFLKFSDGQLANLTNDSSVPDGTPGFTAQGNIYNALVANGDLRSLIANLVTGTGDDTLIGNDRDNHLSSGAGSDTIHTNGGDDIVSGGSGADTIYFGAGHDTLRDALADLNGDIVFDFGQGAVDALGALLGRANLAYTQHQATLSSGGSLVTLNGNFTDGEFLFSQRGSGADAHTDMAFVPYLPTLKEGVAVSPQAINGIAAQGFLTGDGSAHFTVDFRSAQSALANQLGWYKVSADGTIHDAHLLVGNTLDPAAVGRSFDLGAPANGERIGFFLIQGGFTPYGSNLPDDLSFVLPNGQAANVDFWQAPLLRSASLGQLNASPVFHSFAGLNPDWAPQVLSGLQNGRDLVIGFEDVRFNGGDRDYQDVVIAVHFTPHDDRIV